MLKRAFAVLALILAATLGSSVLASPAHAATAHVYISFPTWLGNCPGGGSVVAINASTPLDSVAGDTGDDLVYLRVNLNQRNQINATVGCRNRGVLVWNTVTRSDPVPTYGGQTLWVGPAGWSRN